MNQDRISFGKWRLVRKENVPRLLFVFESVEVLNTDELGVPPGRGTLIARVLSGDALEISLFRTVFDSHQDDGRRDDCHRKDVGWVGAATISMADGKAIYNAPFSEAATDAPKRGPVFELFFDVTRSFGECDVDPDGASITGAAPRFDYIPDREGGC